MFAGAPRAGWRGQYSWNDNIGRKVISLHG